MLTKSFSPPLSVAGLTVLDRDLFYRKISVPCVSVPVRHIAVVAKKLKPYLLKVRGIKPIAPDEANIDHKRILLNPDLLAEASISSPLTLVDDNANCVVCDHELELRYENFDADDILAAVLPDGETIAGYTLVGHLVHLNLREQLLPFKRLIAAVLLDKLAPRCTTVVNKTDAIGSVYRNFEMELLAGVPNFVCEVRENSALFRFDFSKVYWNSRLSTEHARLLDLLAIAGPPLALFDVFAGVGPFAIPAALRFCPKDPSFCILANDLNPESFRWLSENAKANKVDTNIRCSMLDGAEFIRTELRRVFCSLRADGTRRGQAHVAMNLPALAPTFLGAFRGLLTSERSLDSSVELRVHCYCFSKNPAAALAHSDPKAAEAIKSIDSDQFHRVDAMRQILENLGLAMAPSATLNACEVHVEGALSTCVACQLINSAEAYFVRKVAPNKEMLCVSFTVPEAILAEVGDEGTKAKRMKTV